MSDDSRVLAKALTISLVKMPSSDEDFLAGRFLGLGVYKDWVLNLLCRFHRNCLTARIEIRNKSHALGHELLLHKRFEFHKLGNRRSGIIASE